MPEVFFMEKLCIKCQIVKPTSEFGKDKLRSDGLFPYCKRCRVKNPKLYDEWQENKTKGLYHCTDCKEWLPPDEFYLNPHNKSGIHSQCKACSIKRVKGYYHADKDRAYQRNYNRYWNNKNSEQKRFKDWAKTTQGKFTIKIQIQKRRRYAKSVENSLTKDEWFEILKAQNYTCLGCNKKFNSSFRPAIDHIMPLSKGGGLTKDNVQALCKSCNSRKGNKTIDYRLQSSS